MKPCARCYRCYRWLPWLLKYMHQHFIMAHHTSDWVVKLKSSSDSRAIHLAGRGQAFLTVVGAYIPEYTCLQGRSEWRESVSPKRYSRCMVLRMQGILVSLFLYTGIGSSTNILYVCTVSTPAHTHTHTRARARMHVQTHAHVETHTHTCTKHTCVRIYD